MKQLSPILKIISIALILSGIVYLVSPTMFITLVSNIYPDFAEYLFNDALWGNSGYGGWGLLVGGGILWWMSN